MVYAEHLIPARSEVGHPEFAADPEADGLCLRPPLHGALRQGKGIFK